MKTFSMNIRVYYKDTDAGGVVYYTRYAEFMEMARTEMLRSLGMSAQNLIDDYGVICPVVELTVKYKKPARYDDIVTVVITVTEAQQLKLQSSYELFNQHKELLCTAGTTNVGVDSQTFKLKKFPPEFLALFN